MTRIRLWAAERYRRFKAFCRRQAPYLILLLFLFSFFTVFFYNESSSPSIRELGVLWRCSAAVPRSTPSIARACTSSCLSTR